MRNVVFDIGVVPWRTLQRAAANFSSPGSPRKLLDKWSARTPEQGGNWRISGAGYGIHWPDLDEDLSTEGRLRESARRT
ncbi:MAG: DUF2442 domain-containing protein [Bryobacteraceae bacterium]